MFLENSQLLEITNAIKGLEDEKIPGSMRDNLIDLQYAVADQLEIYREKAKGREKELQELQTETANKVTLARATELSDELRALSKEKILIDDKYCLDITHKCFKEIKFGIYKALKLTVKPVAVKPVAVEEEDK
jgi:hypothetical protein